MIALWIGLGFNWSCVAFLSGIGRGGVDCHMVIRSFSLPPTPTVHTIFPATLLFFPSSAFSLVLHSSLPASVDCPFVAFTTSANLVHCDQST
ncbi:hypothetical protein V8D89_013377 [Ganoderma adspersum]